MPDEKRKFTRIFIHCSDSEYGTALMINSWHVARGWKMCGYHEVLQNGYPTKSWFNKRIRVPYLEGAVEIGRAIDSDNLFEPGEMGAHVKNFNTGSYGICIIGKKHFTDKVLNAALTVTRYRMMQFGLDADDVLGHYEKDPVKTCPNIDMKEFRRNLMDRKFYGERKITIELAKKEKEKEDKVKLEEENNFSFGKFFKFFLNLFKP